MSLQTVSLPTVFLARHGETEWSPIGRHTGRIDLPLTQNGEQEARTLEPRLRKISFAQVFTSPLQRAYRTCELAGFGATCIVDPDLVEWDYGEYEGKTTPEILENRPNWRLAFDGCPGGESAEQVGVRVDRIVARARSIAKSTKSNVLLFSSGHTLRVLAARWLGLNPEAGIFFSLMKTASLSALGYEANLDQPTIQLWNDRCHL